MSSDRDEDPVKVLDRALVLGRRERLTQLPILELLATERIERGRWAESMVGSVDYSQGPLADMFLTKKTHHTIIN